MQWLRWDLIDLVSLVANEQKQEVGSLRPILWMRDTVTIEMAELYREVHYWMMRQVLS